MSADDEGVSDMNPPLDGERNTVNALSDNRSAQVIHIDSSKHVATVARCAPRSVDSASGSPFGRPIPREMQRQRRD
jgi:hypothetical protein